MQAAVQRGRVAWSQRNFGSAAEPLRRQYGRTAGCMFLYRRIYNNILYIMATFTDENDEFLVEVIAKNPPLYNSRLKTFKDSVIRDIFSSSSFFILYQSLHEFSLSFF